MPETEVDYQRKFEGEKARAIIWFAILAIIAAVRVSLHDDEYWNFPCNSPCLHITTYLVPLFTTWIWLWVGYAGCMIIYFSEDWFDRFGPGRTVREIARRVGNRVFLFFYPLAVAFFTGVTYGSFVLPDSVLTIYALGVAGAFGFLIIWSAQGVVGQPLVGRKGVLTRTIDTFIELVRNGTEAMGEVLVREWKMHIQPRAATVVTVESNSARRVSRLLLLVLLTAAVAFAWLSSNLPSLWPFLSVALYLVIFAFALVGWLKRGSRHPRHDDGR